MKNFTIISIIMFFFANVGIAQVVPIAIWHFDGDFQDSADNHHGQMYGNVTFVEGICGQAAHFDGESYIIVSDAPDLSALSNFTIELWIRSQAHFGAIISKFGGGPAVDDEFQLNLGGDPDKNRLNFEVCSGQGTETVSVSSESSIAMDTWYHIMAVFNNSEKVMELYINGVLDAFRSPTAVWLPKTNDTNEPVKIGLFTWLTGLPLLYFEGDMDELIIWNGIHRPALPVLVDIKPGSYPNSINLSSQGVIPVALLSSSPDFDATLVDPTTVTLAGAGVAIRGKGKALAHEEDVNGDGLLDLVVQVDTENLNPNQFQDGRACLIGDYVGHSIKGCDDITIVPPDTAPPLNPRRNLAATWASIKSRY